MIISDICGPSMNFIGRGNEQSNPRIRIIRESRKFKMDWLYKHKESVHEETKKSIGPNESHFELPVFSW